MTVTPLALISNKASKYKLLFIHGFMAGPDCLAALLPELSSRLGGELSVAAIALPGHSGEPPSALSLEQYADNLAEAIGREAGSQPLLVYGYSMGGRVALEALLSAKLRPGAVAGLILESSGWGLGDTAERKARLKRDSQLLSQVRDEASFRRFLTAWYRLPLFRGLPESPAYPALIAARLRQNPSWLQAALSQFSVGHQPDRSLPLLALPFPKLYLVGEWDAPYRQRIAALPVADSKAPFTVRVIPGASHNCHVMAPSRCAAAIAEFLSSLTL